MARDILGGFGPDTPKKQVPGSTCGGVLMGDKRDVMNYQPPTGPTSISNRRVGLGGENVGNAGTQGKYSTNVSEGGKVGLGGENLDMGVNRRR